MRRRHCLSCLLPTTRAPHVVYNDCVKTYVTSVSLQITNPQLNLVYVPRLTRSEACNGILQDGHKALGGGRRTSLEIAWAPGHQGILENEKAVHDAPPRTVHICKHMSTNEVTSTREVGTGFGEDKPS